MQSQLSPRPEVVTIHETGPYRLRAPLRGDVTAVASFFRETDLLDIAATTRQSPTEALARAVATSQRGFAIDYGDRCVALGGTTYIPNINRTSIWLLGSEGFDEGLRAGGWRLCKPWFEIMADDAAILFAVLPESNTKDMRWLTWMGFKAEERMPNFRGLGHTCVRMVWTRQPEKGAAPAPEAAPNPLPGMEPVASEAAPLVPGAAARSELARDAAYSTFGPVQIDGPFEPQRFLNRSAIFDDVIAEAPQRSWDPCDRRLLDFSLPFDVQDEPLVPDSLVLALETEHVRQVLTEPAARVRFVNDTMHRLFSAMLYGEQCSQLCAAIMTVPYKDSSARQYAAIRAAEGAKQVDALSRYIESRWGKILPCSPGLKGVLLEIAYAPEASKKAIGSQILIDGLLLNAYAVLHPLVRDPLAADLFELCTVSKAVHHDMGLDWAKRTLPRLSPPEHNAVAEWTARCFAMVMTHIAWPVEDMEYYRVFGLDRERVSAEIAALVKSGQFRAEAQGLSAIFRTSAQTLHSSNLVSEKTLEFFASLVDMAAPPSDTIGARQLVDKARARLAQSRG